MGSRLYFLLKRYAAVWLIVGVYFLCSGCVNSMQLDVYQKSISIPDYAWDYDFKPSFAFEIKDTTARYSLYITLRHTNQYPYSNLWLLVHSNYEGVKPKSKRVELPLANIEGKWFGTGTGDIFEHRIPIQQNVRFDKIGTYYFKLEQDMRIHPLPDVMSVGLRVEKISH